MKKAIALLLSLALGVTFLATGASASTTSDSFTAAMTKMTEDATAVTQAMMPGESETPDVAAITAAIDTVLADIAAMKTAYGSLTASEKTELGLEDDFLSSMDQETSQLQSIKLLFSSDMDVYEPVGTALDEMGAIDFTDYKTSDAGLISAAVAAYGALTADQKASFDSLYAMTTGVESCQDILDAYNGMATNITAIKPLLTAIAELDEMAASVDEDSKLTAAFTVKLNALQTVFNTLNAGAKTALDQYSTINGGVSFTQQLADYQEIAPKLIDNTNNGKDNGNTNTDDSDDNGNPKTGDAPIAGMVVFGVLALGAVFATKKRK